MGFRYRKSINLGGGFRINLSKSGIGYSWGVKGYRVTKTTKGTTRRTASIPGTGISYVEETGRRKSGSGNREMVPTSPQPTSVIYNNNYDTQDIVNNVSTTMVSQGLEDILAATSRVLKMNKVANIGFVITLIIGFGVPVFFIFSCLFAAMIIYVKTKGMIELDYSIDEDQKSFVEEKIQPMIKITQCAKVWRIIQTSKVIDIKYASGANNTVNRIVCAATTKPPFPFKVNLQVASFKAGKETMIFLPDKLFIIQGNKVGALNYGDIFTSSHTTRFVESESVPRDTQIVGQTWKYVNKSGGPDRRFKDNRQLPVCQYGELELKSSSGLDTVIMFSNPNI